MTNLPIKKCLHCDEWNGETCENENSPYHNQTVVANHGCHMSIKEEKNDRTNSV